MSLDLPSHKLCRLRCVADVCWANTRRALHDAFVDVFASAAVKLQLHNLLTVYGLTLWRAAAAGPQPHRLLAGYGLTLRQTALPQPHSLLAGYGLTLWRTVVPQKHSLLTGYGLTQWRTTLRIVMSSAAMSHHGRCNTHMCRTTSSTLASEVCERCPDGQASLAALGPWHQ